ncbi:Ger(x)C family spore germination protein [Psychrobacillus sp. BM2]|uniref:Ger(x)C family spore germination protein n=1 Tax=Psychrobacillus sp. BM2 TaxID=3400421 RepID=UPI003B02753A
MKTPKSSFKSKFNLLFTLTFPLLFLSGCWDVMEVNDFAIVIAAGIDMVEDDSIEVTFLLYVPNPTGGATGENSGSSTNTYSISIKGDTFSDAVMELETKVPRRIFWGHSNLFIFGSNLAKTDLAKQIDFLVRTAEPREQAQIYISEEPPKELLNEFVKVNIAELFSKLPKDRTLSSITLKDVEEMLVNHSMAGVIPISGKTEIVTASEAVESFAVKGSAIIHHGKLVSIVTGEKDLGNRWLVFPKTDVPISITPDETEGKVSAVSTRKSFKLTPKIENGKWKMEIKVKGDIAILQNTTNLDIFKQSINNRLEKEFSQKIKSDIEIFINHIQKDLHADVLQFYEAFYRSFPKDTSKEKENWDQTFENIEVKVIVDINIKDPGITNLRFNKGKE